MASSAGAVSALPPVLVRTSLGHSQICASEAPAPPFPFKILSGAPGVGSGKLRSSLLASLPGNSASLDFPDLAKQKRFLPNAAGVHRSYVAVILNYLPNLGVIT